jgi:hypothetical protein
MSSNFGREKQDKNMTYIKTKTKELADKIDKQ